MSMEYLTSPYHFDKFESAKVLEMKSSCKATDAQLRHQAQESSGQILSYHQKLVEIVNRKEEVIRRRWTKKSKTQRKSIILSCWPEISIKHRPDLKNFMCPPKILADHMPHDESKHRNAFICPNFNLEDLSVGKSMLLLLNTRGRHPPNIFVEGDLNAAKLGIRSLSVDLPFLKDYTMLFDGNTKDTYGQLVPYVDEATTKTRVDSGLEYVSYQGLLVLEIQEKIYRFLFQWCSALLHDVDLSTISIHPTEPEPPVLIDNSEYLTIACMAAEAPYRLPWKVNFRHFQTIIAARVSSAEDYCQNLRCDPGLFADEFNATSDHKKGRIPDRRVSNAYGSIFLWDMLSKQLNRLAILQEQHVISEDAQEPLSEEFTKELLVFRRVLEFFKTVQIASLKSRIPASSPFRSNFCRVPKSSEPPSLFVLEYSDKDYVVQLSGSTRPIPLVYIFHLIWHRDNQINLGLPTLMDEIETMVEHDPKLKAKLTPYVSRSLSDLGLFARLQDELDHFQPWAKGIAHHLKTHEKWVEKEYIQRLHLIMDSIIDPQSVSKLGGALGNPSDGRFHYPCDARRTKKTTEMMRRAEENLIQLWITIDDEYPRVTGKSLGQTVSHICTFVGEIERTPEWVEPEPIRKLTPPGKIPKSFEHAYISSFEFVDSTSGFVAFQPKIKSKTRGVAVPCTENSQSEDTDDSAHELVHKLKPRALKVFKVLFFQPSASNLPGELSWTEFKYAMCVMGFAVQKLYGSAWQFTPPSTIEFGGRHSIQFHEPHSSDGAHKVCFYVARVMGRRLRNAYGWHGGMFVSE